MLGRPILTRGTNAAKLPLRRNHVGSNAGFVIWFYNSALWLGLHQRQPKIACHRSLNKNQNSQSGLSVAANSCQVAQSQRVWRHPALGSAVWVPGCLIPQALLLLLSQLPKKLSFSLPPYHEFSDLSLSCQFCRYHALTIFTSTSTITIITTTFRYRKRYPQYLTVVQSCSLRKSRHSSGHPTIHHGKAQWFGHHSHSHYLLLGIYLPRGCSHPSTIPSIPHRVTVRTVPRTGTIHAISAHPDSRGFSPWVVGG